jgi:hypothetical protein
VKIEKLTNELDAISALLTYVNEGPDGTVLATAARILRECRAAGFITEDGEVRKVLGTLPVTADGYVACQDCVIWHPTDGACYPVPDGLNVSAKVYGGARLVPTNDCYSTREAAAVRGEVKHGPG